MEISSRDDHDRARPCPGGRRERRRLPDPGLAADHQRAAGPLGKRADEVGHDLKFVLTPVQRLAPLHWPS